LFPQNLKDDLNHCFKCGMCQQVCPTFKVMRREYYTPRGRVQIIKHYLEGDLDLTPNLKNLIMSCMLCDACAALCPSGVRIDRLFRLMRVEINHRAPKKLSKKLLISILKNGDRLRKAAALSRIGQRLLVDVCRTHARIGAIPLVRFPRIAKETFRGKNEEKIPPAREKSGRVIYFTGCATDLVYHDVGYAVLRVLSQLGFEVVIPKGIVCCSAPLFLGGAAEASLPNIFKNLDILDGVDADAIVVDCATCGAALKKGIPELLEDLGLDTEKAKRVANKVKDVSQIMFEHIDKLPILSNATDQQLVVTYHDPCHLVRGMGVTLEPRTILSSIDGIKFVEMEGSNECCGGAGSYQFENVDISSAITSRKINNIRATGAHIVVTGCPGCRLTLTGNMSEDDRVDVLHTVQLVSRFMTNQ
jgi:glycolate oxidase iron-sulfur subunit